jgi:hypoxanthine-guanine phosphoribosyltransferase
MKPMFTSETIASRVDAVARFRCPDVFVVGYGMDLANRYRELPFIGKLVSWAPTAKACYCPA